MVCVCVCVCDGFTSNMYLVSLTRRLSTGGGPTFC